MRKSKLIAVIFVLIFCFAVTGCASSVELGGEKHKSSEQQLNITITEEEFSLLDSFTELQSVDFGSSGCYEAIRAWALAHPDVAVSYSVTLPDGQTVGSDTAALDLSALQQADAAAAAELLRYLPELKSVELGSVNTHLDAEAINALRAAAPDVEFTGTVSMLGRDYPLGTQSIDVSSASHSDVPEIAAALSLFAELKSVDFGNDQKNDFSFDDIAEMEHAAPNAEYSYDFTMYEREFSVNTKKINLSHVRIEDEGETVRAALRCMPYCDYLDMDSCGVSNESMAVIRDENPDVNVIWRVFFGYMYSCRTDIEVIVASDSYDGGELVSANADPLKYCTKVRRLDIGHNAKLEDLHFISYMPDLEILITCYSPALKDISAIADCPHLEYIELITAEQITDLSPLSELHELKHLNICNMYDLKDLSPLYGLTQLERLWIGCNTKITEEQIATMQAAAPNCVINSTVWNPTDDHDDYGWRYSVIDGQFGNEYAPRYALLREQFRYFDEPFCYTFSRYDPYFFDPAPTPED